MKQLSVVINTKNAVETVAACLDSVSWADEVIVADMHSTDDTVKLAKQHGATVVSIREYGRVEPEARNQANTHASGQWTLQVDADEVISETLQTEILRLVTLSTNTVSYFLPRKNLIFGQWIQHTGWWPDYQLRLFKTGSVEWKKGVHSKPTINGEVEYLSAKEEIAIIHHNYQSISQFIERLNYYSSLTAKEEMSTELSSSPTSDGYLELFDQEFLRRYFAQSGWRDGDLGLLLSLLQAVYPVVTEAKRRELEGTLTSEARSALPGQQFSSHIKALQYWLAEYQYQTSPSSLHRWYWRVRRKLQR